MNIIEALVANPSPSTTMGRHIGNSLDDIMPENGVGTKGWVEVQRSKLLDVGRRAGRAYTITFTDNNLRMYKESYLKELVDNKIKKTRGYIDHIMIGEYSETGRYHLHGVISYNKLENHATLQRKLRREFGIVKVRCIDNTVRWADYCMKGYTQTNEVQAQ